MSSQPNQQNRLGTVVYGLLPLVIAAVVLFVLVIIGGKAVQGYEMRQEALTVEQRIEDLKKENRRLNRELEYYRSDEYIEKVAREELGLVRPGDVAVALVPTDDRRPSLLLPTSTPVPTPNPAATSTPTWQRWMSLFVEQD